MDTHGVAKALKAPGNHSNLHDMGWIWMNDLRAWQSPSTGLLTYEQPCTISSAFKTQPVWEFCVWDQQCGTEKKNITPSANPTLSWESIICSYNIGKIMNNQSMCCFYASTTAWVLYKNSLYKNLRGSVPRRAIYVQLDQTHSTLRIWGTLE